MMETKASMAEMTIQMIFWRKTPRIVEVLLVEKNLQQSRRLHLQLRKVPSLCLQVGLGRGEARKEENRNSSLLLYIRRIN